MARYRYKALPNGLKTSYIRLVTIHPGVAADDIVISLHIEPFTPHDPPMYEALSYTWGSRKQPKTVYVGKSDKAALRVTRSLRAALEHLRYQSRERVMWIDALCIDQANDVEKGPQVAMMGQLFEYASRVVVWLGPEGKNSSVAMERLEYIGSQVDVDWGGMHRISPANAEGVDRDIASPTGKLPLNTEESIAIADLLWRGWFDRLWIRQEIFVAEDKAIVCCGPKQMPWSVFRKVLRLFYSKRPEPGNVTSLLEDRLVKIGGLVFQMRRTDIMSMRGAFDWALCSDPRDYIYGIRALLFQDQQGLCGEPDYSKSTAQVFSDLVRGYMTTYQNGLTIIRQCELSRRSPPWSGPSWVPDWSTRANYQWLHDSFASSQIRGWFSFPEPGVLQVLGVSTTVIEETWAIPKFYVQGWNVGLAFLQDIAPDAPRTAEYLSGSTVVRALARCLVFGAVSDFMHVRDGNYPTTEKAEAVLLRLLTEGQLVPDDYTMGSDVQRFFKRMDWGSGGKSFVRCTGGYVGVAPPSTQVGDEIFVVVGCQQPLVLRRKTSHGPHRYSVVGECYVEGCSRAEPLLGNLPSHIGFELTTSSKAPGWSRRFRDIRSEETISEDPRLHRLGVDLGSFRAHLAEDSDALLSLAPDDLMARVKDLRRIELV